MYSFGLFSSLERNPTNLCLWGLSLVVCVLGVKLGTEAREYHDYHAEFYLIVWFPAWNITFVLSCGSCSASPESLGRGSQHQLSANAHFQVYPAPQPS